ncbi:MAG: hypothetical protein MR709_07645 [Bacteroidales bacterium]|nr:hypothetical protein [Bacteroidales bacterium]
MTELWYALVQRLLLLLSLQGIKELGSMTVPTGQAALFCPSWKASLTRKNGRLSMVFLFLAHYSAHFKVCGTAVFVADGNGGNGAASDANKKD